ncbi:hypothetical protein OOK48_28755 [Streptomyces viridodiastaticus]|uniref:hypothetical protein n=1 Tax=Streptomyces albogriseolus TaxID=1887 RepID=UPI0022580D4A|nr:hypothetical protein [Streptomyces viridodiastaticus]MCX4570338.1 hypothetical protein [Streptomyces viridodiastaticus]
MSKSSCFAELGTGPYPGEKATREKTEAACRAAHDTAPTARLPEAGQAGDYWYMWSNFGAWTQGGGHISCYVVTARGTAPSR